METKEEVQIYDSSKQVSPAVEEFREIFRYRDLVVQIVRRDILTRYKRSVLGVTWTMINPLGTMIVLAIVFSQAFGTEYSYAAYVLSGLVAWNFFQQTTNASIAHLVWGGALLKRIYVPRTVFAFSALGTGLFNLVLSLIPLLLVMVITGVPIEPTILFLPIPILFLAMFSLGVGLLVSGLAVFYTDIAEMYQIILTAWMYLTPIIYPEEILPEQFRMLIAIFNPMYHMVGLFRAPLYYGEIPSLQETLIAGLIALVTLIIGWFVFTRRSDEFAYRI
ncbi:MAG: ABC transporter permease [Anaerolineales bacterium]|jgi:ABC-2 type transport system permease protein|nr:ABC transporter permease [Anaerolineales bacterium]